MNLPRRVMVSDHIVLNWKVSTGPQYHVGREITRIPLPHEVRAATYKWSSRNHNNHLEMLENLPSVLARRPLGTTEHQCSMSQTSLVGAWDFFMNALGVWGRWGALLMTSWMTGVRYY
jgi:hypothetical protein